MPRPSGPTTEMVRLPADVVRAIRLRAATADVTLAEAARQLMLPRDMKEQLGLLDHVAWLHSRLMRRRDDLVNVFRDAIADADAVDVAIKALGQLHQAWPDDSQDDDDLTTVGVG